MKHVISVLVENKLGALTRVTGLFSGRGFNLESVTVGETEEPDMSRMTIVTEGDDKIVEQITKQLNRLIDTIKVVDLSASGPYVEREILLVKVSYTTTNRRDIIDLMHVFGGKVVDITPNGLTIEVSGPTSKMNAFLGMIRPYGIKEVARSGQVALSRESEFAD